MVDPKAMSRQLRDTISRTLTDSDTLDNVTVRHLLSSHEAADVEITRQSIELTALRLAVEEVRKAVVGIVDETLEFQDVGRVSRAALALLPAPGEPSKLEVIFKRMANAWRSCQHITELSSPEAYAELDIAAMEFCALYPEGK